MSALMRFLMTVLANLAWQRVGGKGAVPPVRLPRSKQPVNIPVLTPWQMMAAMWVARKAWNRFGPQVKSKIDAVNHPAARQVGAWLPDPDLTAGSMPNTATNPAPRIWTTTAQPATPTQPTPPSQPAATAPPKTAQSSASSRDYGTRKLDDDAAPSPPRKAPFGNWRRSSQS